MIKIKFKDTHIRKFMFLITFSADAIYGERCKFESDCRSNEYDKMTCGPNNTCVCTDDVELVYSEIDLRIGCGFDPLSYLFGKYLFI